MQFHQVDLAIPGEGERQITHSRQNRGTLVLQLISTQLQQQISLIPALFPKLLRPQHLRRAAKIPLHTKTLLVFPQIRIQI